MSNDFDKCEKLSKSIPKLCYSTGKKIDGWQWVWVPIAHVYYENEWKRKTLPVRKISRLRKTVFKL